MPGSNPIPDIVHSSCSGLVVAVAAGFGPKAVVAARATLVLGMLLAELAQFLALARFLLAHLAAIVAIGLVLARRRPVDHLRPRLHRHGSDIDHGLGDAAAGQQWQRGTDRNQKLAHENPHPP